jgi:dihydroorotate dehydrogenase electron transfer subunit
MKALLDITVLENKKLAGSLWLASFKVNEGAHALMGVRAGMFAMIKCNCDDKLSFRRPFSFAEVDGPNGTFAVYYRVVGGQTQCLAENMPGDILSAVLPIGNAFTLPRKGEEAVLVGGGVGLAPLLMLSRELASAGHREPRFYLGARTETDLTREYAAKFPALFSFATDDGSYGHKGNVVELLNRDSFGAKAKVYACGPKLMLKALAAVLPDDVSAEASLEEVMACGIGACYGCAVKTTGSGVDEMKLVCRDGPVFEMRSIIF